MFTPEKMEQISVVFSNRDVEPVSEAIISHGGLQVLDSADIEPWAGNLGRVVAGEEPVPLFAQKQRLEQLLYALSLPRKVSGMKPETGDWKKIDQRLLDIERSVNEIQEQRGKVEKEFERLRELRARIEEVPSIGVSLRDSESYAYLTVHLGRVADSNIEILRNKLGSILHVIAPFENAGGMTTLILIALRRDHERVLEALREAGFIPMDLKKDISQMTPDLIRDLNTKIQKEQQDLEYLDALMQKIARQEENFIRSTYYRVLKDTLKQTITRYFRKTDRTYLLSGWIPKNQMESIVLELRRATQNRCIIERMPAEKIESVREGKIEVPVRLKNPPLIKPFEFITFAYGVPAYRTLDPTPFVGLSFLLMFGMMFGDVGHGLILALMGVWLALKSRSSTYKSAGILVFYAGLSSMAYGFLFGSIFGVEDWLPTLWVKPMESISELFKVAIYFGIGMIFVSITINIINGIRKGNLLKVLFDKAGLVAAVLYWCGIMVATRMFTTQAEAEGKVPVTITVLMSAALLILLFREPIVHLIEGKKKLYPEGVGTGLIGGVVEIVEILLGFLANTVSFIRVAAFGLAHAGLFMAIFTLSDMAKNRVSSWIILIIGNIIIIALEGLVVSIQAVRLEFYEFFSRFFEQGTARYRPVASDLEDEGQAL
jgi:V/A-type H+-transporting ATPase subunit I